MSDKSDVLSCKTFPVSRRDKRKSSNTLCENSASKKLKMDGKSLPDFGQLLEAKDKTTESVEVPKPKGTVQSDGPGKQVHRTISLPSSLQLDHVDHKNYKIVKQSSETTQIYASPETSSIIRRQIRKDDEIISSHQIARLHKTPVLKEIEVNQTNLIPCPYMSTSLSFYTCFSTCLSLYLASLNSKNLLHEET